MARAAIGGFSPSDAALYRAMTVKGFGTFGEEPVLGDAEAMREGAPLRAPAPPCLASPVYADPAIATTARPTTPRLRTSRIGERHPQLQDRAVVVDGEDLAKWSETGRRVRVERTVIPDSHQAMGPVEHQRRLVIRATLYDRHPRAVDRNVAPAGFECVDLVPSA